jgi:hypothetical protein
MMLTREQAAQHDAAFAKAAFIPRLVLEALMCLCCPSGRIRDPHELMYFVMTGHIERLWLRDRAMGIVEHDRILTGRGAA